MKRNLGASIAGYFAVLTLLAGCSSNSSVPVGKWNEETSTFSIEEENVEYTLPTDVTLWAIAGPESLPQTMDFFGIDTEKEVCVGIFRPETPLNGALSSSGYSQAEVENMVKEISLARPGQKVIVEKPVSRQLNDSDDRSWYFSLARRIVDPSLPTDTFAINYAGILFDGKTRPFGLVVISSVESTDSIGEIIFEKYVSGLRIDK